MGRCVCIRLIHPRLPYNDDGWAEAAPGPIRRWPWLSVSSRSGFARAPRSPCGTCKRVKTLAASSSRLASASSPPCSLLSQTALEPRATSTSSPPHSLLSNAAVPNGQARQGTPSTRRGYGTTELSRSTAETHS
ncbi:hypothetical protein ACQJBY_036423 [Aegilops geniculata]